LFILPLSIGYCIKDTATHVETNHVETGTVQWARDFEAALVEIGRTGKPIFLLFQEVPGCLGCKDFGREVLSKPLLVEAIESEFLPVLVYNNRPGGNDEAMLKRFDEPSWNFQVIRFLDAKGEDIVPRQDKIWSVSGVAARMIEVLNVLGHPVPLYLQAIFLENDIANNEVAGFAMACFWTGEYKLGRIDGVVKTEAGWFDHREITLVTYNKKQISRDDLIARAAREKCAQVVYLPKGETTARWRFPVKALKLDKYRLAEVTDQKKQLEDWPKLRNIAGLTSMQLTKMNSLAAGDRSSALKWLSPHQLALLRAAD
jgi:hypothetical protein